MKTNGIKRIMMIAALAIGGAGISIQPQQPIGPGGMPIGGPGPVISAPGSPAGLGQTPPPPGGDMGNGPAPAPGSEIYNPGPPPPSPAPLIGNGPAAPLVVETPLSNPDWQNQGTMTVIACGYDAQSVWRTIPLRISYVYDGAQYNVTVDSAWNPWTDCWNYGIDVPAFSTYYFLNGNYYNYYTNLSTGTFYFNL